MSKQYLYRHWDKDRNLLYVGISLSAVTRLSQHSKNAHWFDEITTVTIEIFDSREDVVEAERIAITGENPRYNVYRPSPQEQRSRAGVNEENSREDLVKRIVQFNPVYTLDGAASLLGVGKAKVIQWIEEKKLGWIHCGVVKGRWGESIKRRITGWQLIDFIENWENESKEENQS